MTNLHAETLRAALTEIVVEAGALIMEGFHGSALTRTKGVGGDLVTEYDERCEALLRERLCALLPEAAFVGEESGGEWGHGLAWHVDPIDGTGNYAHGHPWFAVSVGLWSPDGPVLGAVHAPAMGLMYTAAKGQGATCNGRALRVSGTTELENALLATGFPHDRATNPANNYGAFVHLDARTHGVRRCAAAALELAVLAGGGYDGFWDRGLSSWDVAAAVCLIEEAGGHVSHLEGQPFVLAPKVEILASNGILQSQLKAALAHVRALPPESMVQ